MSDFAEMREWLRDHAGQHVHIEINGPKRAACYGPIHAGGILDPVTDAEQESFLRRALEDAFIPDAEWIESHADFRLLGRAGEQGLEVWIVDSEVSGVTVTSRDERVDCDGAAWLWHRETLDFVIARSQWDEEHRDEHDEPVPLPSWALSVRVIACVEVPLADLDAIAEPAS